LGRRFRHAPIELNKEMEDIKEIIGMNTQLETSRQLEISPTLLLALRSWNLGMASSRKSYTIAREVHSQWSDHWNCQVHERKAKCGVQV
jgi:hypothetical protein